MTKQMEHDEENGTSHFKAMTNSNMENGVTADKGYRSAKGL